MPFDLNQHWNSSEINPFIIGGPCSAESYEQLYSVCEQLSELSVPLIRAGVWKPRTRPGGFEGMGKEALGWIQRVKNELNVNFVVEVASTQHVEEALKYGIGALWIGARSSANPFTMQEIAESLRGVDVPVFVKNPINPDLSLWVGAIERIHGAGIDKVAAIHRGFSTYAKSEYRNPPTWQIPIELKRLFPELPLICDPSHISGDRSKVFDIAQAALLLNYDGLMIEVHPDPEKALSDAAQQITPMMLKEMMQKWRMTRSKSSNIWYNSKQEAIRTQIDELDKRIVEAIGERMHLVRTLGEYKKENQVSIFQVERWDEIFKTRSEWGEDLELNALFLQKLYQAIHDESIRLQSEIMNNKDQVEGMTE